MNVLYFEGAGMDYYSDEQTNFSDVGNFRIRTAFENNAGDKIYLELGHCSRYTNIGKNGKTLKKSKVVSKWALYVSHCFKITGDNDDCNKNRIKTDFLHIRDNYNYTKESITSWVNENLNCSFDTIEVLDFFYGYRVHGDNNNYNLMENIELDHERAAKRKSAYNNIDMEYRNLLNEKYSKIGLMDMDNESITIRCYASEKALGDIPRKKRIKI